MKPRFPPIAVALLPAWIEAACELRPSYFDRAGTLYDSWRGYAHSRDAEPGSPAEFAAAMEARGFECDRLVGERTRIRWGIRLRQPCHALFEGGGEKSGRAGRLLTAAPLIQRFFSRKLKILGLPDACARLLTALAKMGSAPKSKSAVKSEAYERPNPSECGSRGARPST